MIKNLHTKLEQYSEKCDKVFLSSQLQSIMAEAKEVINEVEPTQLYQENYTILVDVREPEEFASGYIKADEVLTIPRGKLEFTAIDKIAHKFGQDVAIVTYCLKGSRGLLAAYQLHKMGFSNVRNLNGGILNWLNSGYSIYNYLGKLKLG